MLETSFTVSPFLLHVCKRCLHLILKWLIKYWVPTIKPLHPFKPNQWTYDHRKTINSRAFWKQFYSLWDWFIWQDIPRKQSWDFGLYMMVCKPKPTQHHTIHLPPPGQRQRSGRGGTSKASSKRSLKDNHSALEVQVKPSQTPHVFSVIWYQSKARHATHNFDGLSSYSRLVLPGGKIYPTFGHTHLGSLLHHRVTNLTDPIAIEDSWGIYIYICI